ncbi:MAG: DUF3015 family protein [Candidatus Competibacteraceae bacterium]|nr:DUF3015 family protein [Candidatus Competibacteraceae bacterium]
MKPLLNAALTAALGFALGACTIVSDPSSGASAASSGSSGSGAAASKNRQDRTVEFAKLNLERLRGDMAAGGGEYLSSLATLMAIEPTRQPAFFKMAQAKFSALFPSERTSAVEMLATLEREWRADPRFGPRLSAN